MNIVRAIAVVAALALSAGPAWTQDTTPAPPEGSTLDGLVEVLKDDAARQRFIEQLEKARSEPPQSPAAAAGAVQQPRGDGPEADALFQEGLLTGVSAWFVELGQRLPTAALGSPLSVKVGQAEAQIERRLSRPDAVEKLQNFGMRSTLGWSIVTLLAFFALGFVSSRIRRNAPRRPGIRALGNDVAKRVAFASIPVAMCVAASSAWAHFLPYSEFERLIFMLLALPFAFGLTASGITASLLVLLAPSKGARVIAYAQRRLAPLLGVLVGIAAAGSVVATPQIRSAIGPATGDLASLSFDLAVPIFAGFVIAMHRRTVRSLIVRGHPVDPTGSVLDRATYWLGTNWQYFGFAFVILNIGARLFGARSGSFLTQSSLSVVLIVLAFIAVAGIRRLKTRRVEARSRRPIPGVRAAVNARLADILYSAVQVGAVALATSFCLGLWGIDLGRWIVSGAGIFVVGPVLSIVLVILVAWILWVVLDAWVGAVLAPAQGGPHRERSVRVKTLLPLLRNVAFVVLSVLNVIGVLRTSVSTSLR